MNTETNNEQRLDSIGRVCKQPDPVGNEAFDFYAKMHGIESARAAFGLWEDDPHG